MNNKRNKPMKDLPESIKLGVDSVATTIKAMEPAETATGVIKPTCLMVTINLPVQSECPLKSFQDEATRVDLRKITRERMSKIRALRRGLTTVDSRLADGSQLRTNSDVLYYILDQIDIPK
jgi:hypothetical protein